jgi:PleD family two-component response regulator
LDRYALIVAEDLFVETALKESAQAHGIAIERVHTAKEALDQATSKPPAVIFLDLASKKLRPLALIKHLKDDDHPAHRTRIVGFGTHAGDELRTKAKALGCDFTYSRTELAKQAPSVLRQLL